MSMVNGKITNYVSVLGLGAYSLENLTAWLTQTMDVFQKKTMRLDIKVEKTS